MTLLVLNFELSKKHLSSIVLNVNVIKCLRSFVYLMLSNLRKSIYVISRTIMHGTQNLENLKKAKLGGSYHANIFN